MTNDSGKKNRLKSFVVFHLPAILYAAAIISVSSIRDLHAPQVKVLALDKVAHFLEYAVFAFLAYRSFSHMGKRVTAETALILSAVFVCLFAVFDEFYQRLIPGRKFDLLDLLTDASGAALVLLFLYVRKRRSERVSAGR